MAYRHRNAYFYDFPGKIIDLSFGLLEFKVLSMFGKEEIKKRMCSWEEKYFKGYQKVNLDLKGTMAYGTKPEDLAFFLLAASKTRSLYK